MPTIKINERDLSWYYRQRQPGQITVLMPGVATFGPCNANDGSLALVNENNFTKMLGTSSVDSRDFSYNVAKSFVKSGIDVLFWRVRLPGQATASKTYTTVSNTSVVCAGNGATTSFPLKKIVATCEGDGSTKDFVINPVSDTANATVVLTYLKPVVSDEPITDTFSGDGTKTEFTLSQVPSTDSAITVTVGGSTISEGFTISDKKLVFDEAPVAGTDNITVTYNYIVRTEYRSTVMTTDQYTFNESGDKITFTAALGENDTVNIEGALDINDNISYEVSGVSVNESEVSYTYDDTTKIVTLVTPPANEDTVIINYKVISNTLRVDAKYPGTFGNNLKLVINTISAVAGTYRVMVYDKTTSVLIENLLVNFKDMDSEYYYSTVNLTTDYIEFAPTEYINEFRIAANAEAEVLSGGLNGTYDINTITDYLAGSESNAVWADLKDPLSRIFNVVTSSGYNSYDRFVFDNYVVDTTTDCIIHINGVTPTKNDIKVYFGDNEVTEGVTYWNNDTKVTDDVTTVNIVKVATSGFTKGDYIKAVCTLTKLSSISQIDDRFIGLCEDTGLAFYLVDGAQNFTYEEFYNYTSLPTEDRGTTSYSTSGFNTSYAAPIGPWCSAILTATGATRMLPGSYVFLIQWAQSLASGSPMYLVPAGVKRASLNFVKSTAYPVGSAVLDLWQNHEIVTGDTHKIIPIANIRQYGYVIYGNTTSLKDMADGSTSMLQTLSTRIISNMIKAVAFDISITLQFDQLSSDLFIEFREKLNEFLSQLKYNNALYDYEIVADTTNLTLDDINNRTVPVKIRISPTPTAENFDITLEISQAGVTFGSDDLQNVTTEV